MSKNDLTIIINTFNSDEKIFSCLDSINCEFKILIIENSSNKEFKETIEKKYPNVDCELTGFNLGYANGNNLGLSKVKTKFALILNPDTKIEKDSLDNFLLTAEKYPEFAIIGPAIQEEGILSNEVSKKIIEVNNVKGFAMFLNIHQFKEIGFFDDNFFIYFEEIDLCKRLRKKDKKLFLDPSILISHIGGSSHDNEINFEMEVSRNWHWMWSSFYFYKKHYGYFFALLKMSRKLFSAFIKSTFYYLLKNTKKNKIYFSRLSGLMSSILMKKSWYRPKID